MADIESDWKSRIDADVRKLAERMAGVEVGVLGIRSSFDKFSDTFNKSVDRQRELVKPQYQVIIGALTLVAIVLGGFMSGYVRDLNRLEHNQEVIRNKRLSDADSGQDIRLENLENHNAALLSHMSDGHPDRIEEMFKLQAEVIDSRMVKNTEAINRELKIRKDLRNELKRRLDLMEARWEREHTGGHTDVHVDIPIGED